MTTLSTERLVLQPMALADLDWFAVLRGDPEVMRYIGIAGPLSYEQSRERLERLVRCWAEY
ncbi:MAG: GNAT family N-acetyltransferase, partial [Gemmatimonadaceae bacterium]|nr:GNAT family N-acetyltransferase [Gemmatimonadaceae bacterium]